jgi:ADP-ribose pyrophosphatase
MTSKTRPRRRKPELIFQGRIFRIEREQVALAHGRTLTMEAVRHRGSVVLIPQPAPGKLILIRQFRYVVNQWLWELPAGSLEEGEAPARAAVRECQEEIGLRPTRTKKLGTFYPSPGFCDERMIFYLCSGLRAPSRHFDLDPDEQLEPRIFTVAEVRRMVDRGEVSDLKTIVGLMFVERGGRPGKR